MLEFKPVGMNDPDYARFFTQARVIAWQYGFALLAHGTYTRDLDLLMVPWEARAFEGAVSAVINRIAQVTGTKIKGEPSEKPHGRRAWTLYLPGENEVRWVDLSVMPCIAASPPLALTRDQRSDEMNPAVSSPLAAVQSEPAAVSAEPRKPLTEEEIWRIYAEWHGREGGRVGYARAVEQAHGIGAGKPAGDAP